MKRATILALALALMGPPAAVVAQSPADLDSLVRRGDLYLNPETMAPFSGPVVAMYYEQQVRERGTLRDGRWDGVRESFHLNGGVSLRETYRDGQLHGPTEAFFRSGQLSARESYRDGLLDGLYESYWFNRGDESIERVAERGRWSAGRPCGEWMTFGQARMFPPCA